MSFVVATTRVVADTGGGNQDITTTKLGGLTPKSAIFVASYAVTDATDKDHASMSLGLTDGTNHACVATFDEHNLSNSDNKRRATSDEVIMLMDPTAVNAREGEANFNSWLTDGVRITWGDGPDTAFFITVYFFAGTDVTAYVDDGGGSPLGCGFTPDICIGVSHRAGWADSNSNNAALSFGACLNDGSETQYSSNLSCQDNQGVSSNSGIVANDSIIENNFPGSDGTPSVITGFTSNGFTHTGSTFSYLVMEFNGNFSAEIIEFTTPTTTGNKAITGAGFKPQAAIMAGCGFMSSGFSVRDDTSILSWVLGMFDDTDEFVNLFTTADSQTTGNTSSRSDSEAFRIQNHLATDQSVLTFVSFDSDGLTLSSDDTGEENQVTWILVFEEDAAPAPRRVFVTV